MVGSISLLALLFLIEIRTGFEQLARRSAGPVAPAPGAIVPSPPSPAAAGGGSDRPAGRPGRFFGRMVWMRDITGLLREQGVSPPLAQEIARWLLFYCRYYRVPPDLALAVMYVESGFDRFAVSPAGAIGLMQVMPFWREELGERSDDLFDVEVNIRYGCAILRRYLDRYRTVDEALSAYNGSVGSRRYVRRVRAAMRRFGAIPTLADLVG